MREEEGMDINWEYDIVRQMLSDRVEEIFIARQGAHGIVSGDISPLNAYKLDFAIDELADSIVMTLMCQAPEAKRCTPISPRSEASDNFIKRFVTARKEGHDLTDAPPRSVGAWESAIEEWKSATALPDREPHTPPFMNKGVIWYAIDHPSECITHIIACTAHTYETTYIDTGVLLDLIAE